MLRFKNGSASKRLERLMSSSAAGGVLAIALAVTFLRGPAASAEQPADETAAPVEAAPATAAPVEATPAKVARRIEPSVTPSIPAPDNAQQPLFAREPFDPSIIPRATDGAFLVRLGTLAQLPALQSNIDMANHTATAFLRAWTKNADIFVDLRQIEWVAGSLFAKFTHRDEKGGKGKFETGTGSVVIRLTQAGDWQETILRRVTGATLETHNGRTYVKLPELAVAGGAVVRLHFPDDKTVIACGLGEKVFFADLDRADSDKNSRLPYAWADAWRAVDGGLVTVVYDQGKLELAATPADKKDWPEFAVPLLENAKYYAAGWDWSQKSQRTAVQVHGTCADREAVAALELAARALLERAPELLPSPDELFGKYQDQVLQMISGARLEASPAGGDGHFVHVTIEGPLTEKEFLGITQSTK
ncbi:MAG TPA: hypothetical protein VHY91_01260 [Pirellulales bacterium]|jgi:hypothetical protein|nr:hypothetical protein [Pirellulales bacterium]